LTGNLGVYLFLLCDTLIRKLLIIGFDRINLINRYLKL